MDLTPDQEEQFLSGGGEAVPETPAPAAGPQEPTATPPQTPAPDPAQQGAIAPGDSTTQQQPAGRGGNVDVPIGRLRAENRNLSLENERLQGMLEALQQGMTPQGGGAPQGQPAPAADVPQLAIENPAAIEAIVQQAIAPYAQTIQQLQGVLQQKATMDEVQMLAQAHPDAPDLLAQFDAEVPELREQMPAKARYFMAKGIMMSQPGYQQQMAQQTAAQARELAIDQTADLLKTPGNAPSADPSALPPARPNQGQAFNDASVPFDQWAQLNPDDEERLLGKGIY